MPTAAVHAMLVVELNTPPFVCTCTPYTWYIIPLQYVHPKRLLTTAAVYAMLVVELKSSAMECVASED